MGMGRLSGVFAGWAEVFPIPESLTGPTYHANTLLSLLKSKVATDNSILPNEALLTPAGDFLVAFGVFSYREPVRIFGIKQQALERKPALSVFTSTSLGWGFNVVMVQWALGKHVREWNPNSTRSKQLTSRNPTLRPAIRNLKERLSVGPVRSWRSR